MDTTNRRVLIIGIVLTVTFTGLTYISDILVKGNLAPFNSLTIEESKEGGYFLREYRPLTRKIKLTYHQDSVEFFRLWTEKERKKEKIWLFYNTILSGNNYFQIDYKQFPSNKFLFEIDNYGGHGGRGTFNFTTDTVTFQIIERSPDDTVGWTEYLMGQKIKFVKVD